MVVNIEDAGFEIRDQIQWLYGSGFPKSLNIGKAFDKKEGTSPYEGLGTGLKPANEPICLARKPISEKTIVDNVIKWGTGGLNIDGCRIGTEILTHNGCGKSNIGAISGSFYKGTDGDKTFISEGRWPANVIFDEEAAIDLDKQSGVTKSTKFPDGYVQGFGANNNCYSTGTITNEGGYDDKGGASRFFYVAKVSKKERNLGLDDSDIAKNNHPTLKPINLMSYLIKLITPEGGVVLDPFMGSGSCGIAAALGDYKYIGMELDEDYFKIAEQRIKEYEQYRKLLKK
jgi:site-specific DNA-methyltransferase (adenine-specific)